MPCTTLLAGKNATYDGSTLMARNEDASSGHFTAKKFIVVNPSDQPTLYKSVISKVEIPLPTDPIRYTAVPDAVEDEGGIWGEAGINDLNVAMTATETITSNPRVLGADPLVETGIGEEDLVTIVLPYIHSARDGVIRLGGLLEQYGTYEMNGIGFQDTDEIWWLETIGGHHWIAKRVPDDSYVVMPNQQGIDFFDFADAFAEQKDHMCSADMIEFITENHLDLTVYDEGCKVNLKQETMFDVRAALGSHSDSDHVYNTPRAWYMLKCLNPNTCCWEGDGADFTPESDDLPWSMVPEHRLTVEDFKYILSSYYQGTEYNPYSHSTDSPKQGKYRAIGINRNNFLSVTQLRPYMPEEIKAVQWIAEGSNAFNTIVPFYTNVRTTPEYMSNTDITPTTESFYWVNRIIGALADAHYGNAIMHVERYQLKTVAAAYNMLKEADKHMQEMLGSSSDAAPVSTEAIQAQLGDYNQKMADMLKDKTYDLLNNVLFTASNEMKNAFSRSDS